MRHRGRPIVVTGATGTLGRTFSRICDQRGLPHALTRRAEMDIGVEASVREYLEATKPWAVINTAGYVRVDQAESEPEACARENTAGPVHLARVCASKDIPLVTFSSDLVFDGSSSRPYVESDPVAPLNVYGRTKAEAEQGVLAEYPGALVVRTSAFFGPWDEHNFATIVLRELGAGRPFTAASDAVVSPTYVPSLVDTTLDLLIDGESGLWHVANDGEVTWEQFARAVAEAEGVSGAGIEGRPTAELGLTARRPLYSVLGSERGKLMPTLSECIGYFLRDRECF